MKKLFLVISILALLCGAAFASGPAVQLTATGSTVGDCTGGAVPILTPTQFNANTGGYIVPGATITMCGTFTGSTTTLLTTPAAGTAGSQDQTAIR